MSVATYTYCVVETARRPSLTRVPPGLPAADAPQLLDIASGTWLVCASVPLERYGAEALDQSLRNLEWISEIAVAHESVVEHFARLRGATVIPMKLFTMFASPARAVAAMRQRRRHLTALLDKLRGCEEWGVRILRSAERPPARTAIKPVTGRAFLAARKQARDASLESVRDSIEAADETYAALAAVAAQYRRRETESSGITPPLLDAAFLVPVRRRARFQELARRAARDVMRRGGTLTLTGPWPAYNFVSGSEDPA